MGLMRQFLASIVDYTLLNIRQKLFYKQIKMGFSAKLCKYYFNFQSKQHSYFVGQ